MSRHTHNILAAFCFLIAVFFWRLGVIYAGDVACGGEFSTVRLTEPLLAGDFVDMERMEGEAASPLGFALWSEWGGERVEAPEFGRGATAAVLTVRGDTRLVLPGSATLDPADVRGCLLDRETARSLFGGGNAAGSLIRWEGEDYEVRGTVELPAPALLVTLRDDGKKPLGLLTVADGDPAEFLARHGLGSRLAVRGVLFTGLAAVLSGLPLFAGALLLFTGLFRLGRRWRGYPLRGVLISGAIWGLAAILLLRLFAVIPPELLPGRWSDFSGWAERFRGWRRELFELFAAEKPRPELRMAAEALRSACGAVSALFLLAGAGIYRLNKNKAAPRRNQFYP